MIVKLSSLWIVLTVVVICLVAGCATSPPTESPQPTPTTATSTTVPSTTSIPGTTRAPVQAVDFNLLMKFLPDAPAGWTADEPTGGRFTTQEGSWSSVSREYKNIVNDRKEVQVTIVDSAYYAVGGWEAWNSFTTIETTDGYFRPDRVAGFPAWETYTKPSSYGKWIGINERFMVYVSVEGTKADLDLFVNAINYGGIAALS